MPGTLYIVATPIGNLEDMTSRAVRILREVDLIAAEDTRHTRKLLSHFAIATPLVSYYREKETQRATELIEQIAGGASVALVSDAGTPGISDPGAILVRQARAAGLQIVPIPGPSALSAAVCCAGLEPGTFLFLGFAPAKRAQRRTLLQSLKTSPYPLVFYESPHRIVSFIKDCAELLGDRVVLWAREISKMYEDIEESTLRHLAERIDDTKIRGELVIIIHPGDSLQPPAGSIEDILCWYRDQSELSMKDACRRVASDLGVGRSEVYQRALELWQKR
ncbi:MAG: 16S rRNA (cytidine(1402)-2'-O)-methyltransferase [Desulfofustis sp.]|nr:16S rRNA (cytidine(1402)-2'-O)-methyltransferase [Desulfofustis sp.]